MSLWILCPLLAGLVLSGPVLGQVLAASDPAPAPDPEPRPAPPAQPASGPGGSDYPHDRIRVREYGRGADAYWIFEPADIDKPTPRPVVLFVHGMNLPRPGVYRQWLTHLVRRGHLVVYPRYQSGSITDPTNFTDATARAMRDALQRMDGTRHAKADTARLAMVGHSLGATIALNLAARPDHFGLPAPEAVMAVLPGDVEAERGLGVFFPRVAGDYSTIAADTLLLVIASTNDAIVGQRFAERIYRQTPQIDRADKDLLLISDDRHGRPGLSADHFMPLAYKDRSGRRDADAYDFALWRWFDALGATAFGDRAHRAHALGNTPEQRTVGAWSDGRVIRVRVYAPEDGDGDEEDEQEVSP